MTDLRLDVLAIGNAIVDVIADATDDFLAARGADQGLDAADRRRRGRAALRAHGPGARGQRRLAPGTPRPGVAALGGKRRLHRPGRRRPARRLLPARPDRGRGRVHHAVAADVGVPTARSLILVTPDGHRTMNTFLGAAQHLAGKRARRSADRATPRSLYLEGYLWDPETPRYAMVRAIEVARAAGRKVAFTPVRHLLHRPPPRRLQRADRRRRDRHPVRQ